MACIYTSLLQQEKSAAVKTYKRLLISEARRKRERENTEIQLETETSSTMEEQGLNIICTLIHTL